MRATSRIRFKAYRPDGEIETGTLEAVDEADAVRQLRQSGRIPFELGSGGTGGRRTIPAPAKDGVAARGFTLETRLDLGRFFTELSVMLEAGFTIDVAIKAVADAETSRPQKRRAAEIHGRLTEGLSVSQAFAAAPEITDDVAALLASGESSGRLDVVVRTLADTFMRRAARRREVTEALMYPAFLMVVMIFAFLLLSLYLAPALKPVFENAGVPAPAVVRVLLAFGAFVGGPGPLLFAAAGAAMLPMLLWFMTPAGRDAATEALLRVPGLSTGIRSSVNARYLTTMSLLLDNGVPMLEAMRLAAATAATASQHGTLLAARTRVSEGAPFWQAIGATGQFPDPIVALLRLGEKSNILAAMLGRSGLMIDGLLQRRVARLLTFLTPVITLLMGGLVGGLVVSVMTALLSINEIAIQ
ncbi:general secretion pathway protein F [Palleronia marisminoris]|uniref:Type II secretion system protein F n=1 Tax=Palleronia marisminoris TaxID=315423 RepID=A0A1Y5T685_9RHOB|nr:type II secretion system F family protein [Palleronia marisminoris]SFH20256.1 general secretion pathway protein F [Palleronia marisminoris]SLN56846.1 Type II secretion system protein F [Palleronia marisminoris]